MAELSKKEGMEMFQKNDEDHLEAMNEMKEFMSTPGAMATWFENKERSLMPCLKMGRDSFLYNNKDQLFSTTKEEDYRGIFKPGAGAIFCPAIK